MTIQQDLKALQKRIKALEKKTEKLVAKVDKQTKFSKTTTGGVRTKKSPAEKGTAKLTATDQVLRVIKRSKTGVDAATLMKKTGFDDKKIRNILHRNYKLGKIRRAGKGIYVAT